MANKKMNFSSLKARESKKFTQKKVFCDDYVVLVDESFRESKFASLLEEALKKMNYIKENNIEIDFASYSLILIIKHFTDIDIPEDLDKQLQILNMLIDFGYLKTILNSFDETEMAKLNARLIEYGKNAEKLVQDLKEKESLELEEGDII